MGLAVTDPKNPRAYKSCCHAFVAQVIALNPKDLPNDARILLLGHKVRILHSVLVDPAGEIIADTQRVWCALGSKFNNQSRRYKSQLSTSSNGSTELDVVGELSVGEFRQDYLVPTVQAA